MFKDFSSKGGLPTFVVIIFAAVLIFSSALVSYFLGKNAEEEKVIVPLAKEDEEQQVVPEIISTTTSNNIEIKIEDGLITMGNFIFDLKPYRVFSGDEKKDIPIQYFSLPKTIADKINWTGFFPIEKMGFFNPEHYEFNENTGEEYGGLKYGATQYYLGGWFEFQGKNGLVVFADAECIEGCMGGGWSDPSSMFVLYDGQIVLLEIFSNVKSSPSFGLLENPFDYIVRSRVKADKNFSIPYIDFPNILTINSGVKLELKYTEPASQTAGMNQEVLEGLSKVGSVPIFGDVYMGDKNFPESETVFSVLGRDGRVRYYEHIPSFLKSDQTTSFVLQDGSKTGEYRYWASGKCGGAVLNVVPKGILDRNNDLVVVGKNSVGENVFKLKDENHQLLKDFYDSIYFPVEGEKINYENFIKELPAVFWIDSFDRLIMFSLDKFTPAAECGKPVIYLYPEEETKVDVSLRVKRFSYTEPEYGNGWRVLAKPNGEIYNFSDNKIYPYLFWEGVGAGNQPEIKEGFVVAKENVEKFLVDKLYQLGLRGREIKDFVEFWQPLMTESDYYLVSFLGTKAMDVIAPLTVSPKPDTIIRVLMDYKPLDYPVIIKEQKLSHPPRMGFTVIEWGGVLQRK